MVRDEAERRSWRTSRQAWRAAGVRVGKEDDVAESAGSFISIGKSAPTAVADRTILLLLLLVMTVSCILSLCG